VINSTSERENKRMREKVSGEITNKDKKKETRSLPKNWEYGFLFYLD
jgi:hypothetical protein